MKSVRTSVHSRSIQYTIRQKWCGPVIYVRRAVAADPPGHWAWSRWRKATDSQRDDALVKLLELNE